MCGGAATLVLTDPGSYLYNGSEVWHRHFYGTASHNTVEVDGRDQMLHYRKFKNLYWTKADLKRFEESDSWVLCEGEHYGYGRHSKGCVHNRSILFLKNDDLWIVADRIAGPGEHRIGLQWLGGEGPWSFDADSACLTMRTPAGPFSVSLFDSAGRCLPATVAAGRNAPPRGWLSRYYGDKVAVPSLAAEVKCPLPFTAVSVLYGGGRPQVEVAGEVWCVRTRDREWAFSLNEAGIRPGGPAMTKPCAF